MTLRRVCSQLQTLKLLDVQTPARSGVRYVVQRHVALEKLQQATDEGEPEVVLQCDFTQKGEARARE